jgi:hypothetical protein
MLCCILRNYPEKEKLSVMLIKNKCKSGYNRDTCTLMFIAVPFTIAKLWKQPRCPTTEEWIKKL